MIRLGKKSILPSWELQQRRIIRETEQFLDFHLANPDQTVRIPATRVEKANFKPWMTNWFWGKILDL